MAVEEQGQAPLRYMSVPEKIELGGGGGGGGVSREPSGAGARYRPMKVDLLGINVQPVTVVCS